MPSIKDVAKLSGVSIATVSNVINKTKYVSSELVIKVENAIETLGYRQDLFAKSLKTGKSGIIALMIPCMESPVYTALLAEIVREARIYGLGVLPFDAADDDERDEDMISSHLLSYCDGVIDIPACPDTERTRKLMENHALVQIMPGKPTAAEHSYVYTDMEPAMIHALNLLAGAGHRSIAFVASGDYYGKQWFKAYDSALSGSGLSLIYDFIKSEGGSLNGGYKAVNALLLQESKPTAIFVAHDMMLLGAVQALHGCDPTGHIALAGIASQQFAQAHPKVLSLVADAREIAEQAVELLVAQLEGEQKHSGICVPVTIIA